MLAYLNEFSTPICYVEMHCCDVKHSKLIDNILINTCVNRNWNMHQQSSDRINLFEKQVFILIQLSLGNIKISLRFHVETSNDVRQVSIHVYYL